MKRQTGFTLIEILISLLLGLIIITATISIYISTIRGSSDIGGSARLNHDLEMAVSMMVNDIRRAGYWGGAVAGSIAMDNAFIQNLPVGGTTDVQIHSPAAEAPAINTCVLYSYDADGNGYDEDPDNPGFDLAAAAITVAQANEYYGFKLDQGTIRMRASGTRTDDITCADGSWNTGELVDDDMINITALSLTPRYSCVNTRSVVAYNWYDLPPLGTGVTGDHNCVTAQATAAASATASDAFVSGDILIEIRAIEISVTGQLLNDSAVTKTITNTVKVRNNRIYVHP